MLSGTHKRAFFVITLLFLCFPKTSPSQNKLILEDTSALPTIRLHYDYISNDSVWITDSLGRRVPLTYDYCADSCLVAVSIDNSGSMLAQFDASPPYRSLVDGAKYIGASLIGLTAIPPTHWSLAYCDNVARTLADQLATPNTGLFNLIPVGYGNDFAVQLLDFRSGLLTLASKGNYVNRFAIIITDGLWTQLDTATLALCISMCRTNGIRLFCVFLGDGSFSSFRLIKDDLKMISDTSGGTYFDSIMTFRQADSAVQNILHQSFDPNEAGENEQNEYDGDETFYPCGITFVAIDTCYDQTYYVHVGTHTDTLRFKGHTTRPKATAALVPNQNLQVYGCDTTFTIKYLIRGGCVPYMIDLVTSTYQNSIVYWNFANDVCTVWVTYGIVHYGPLADTVKIYFDGQVVTTPVSMNFVRPPYAIQVNGQYGSFDTLVLGDVCNDNAVEFDLQNLTCLDEDVTFDDTTFVLHPFATESIVRTHRTALLNDSADYGVTAISDSAKTTINIHVVYKNTEVDSPFYLPDTVRFVHHECVPPEDSFEIVNLDCIDRELEANGIAYNVHTTAEIDPLGADSVLFTWISNGAARSYTTHIIYSVIAAPDTITATTDRDDTVTVCSNPVRTLLIKNFLCDSAWIDTVFAKNGNFQILAWSRSVLDSADAQFRYVGQLATESDVIDTIIVITRKNDTVQVPVATHVVGTKHVKFALDQMPVRDSLNRTEICVTSMDSLDVTSVTFVLKSSTPNFAFYEISVTDPDTLATSTASTDTTALIDIVYSAPKTLHAGDVIFCVHGLFYLSEDSVATVYVDSMAIGTSHCTDSVSVPPAINVTYINACGAPILKRFLIGNDVTLVAPNPAWSQLVVMDNNDTQVRIYDNLGKLMIQSKTNAAIDVSRLANGVYYVVVRAATVVVMIQR